MASSSRSGAAAAQAPGSNNAVAPLATIDDAVSLIRSLDLQSTDNSEQEVDTTEIRNVLLPTLLKQYRHQKGKGQRIFLNALQGGIDPLAMLDPAANTLGYTTILAVRATSAASPDDAQVLIPFVDQLARSLTAQQLGGAGEIVLDLVQGIVNMATILADPVWSIPSLLRILDAFRRCHGGINNLTALHPVVLYQCLKTAHYETAMEWIVRHDIISAETSVCPLAYTDVMEYFYYAGLVSTKIKDYTKACEAYEQCVCTPAQSVSAIQVDAFKKLRLVQLLKDGKTSALPPYASQSVTRAIRGRIASIEVYNNFARSYSTQANLSLTTGPVAKKKQSSAAPSHHEALLETLSAGTEIFVRDLNYGLVKQLMALHLRRQLQRMGKFFVRLSVGDIVQILSVDSAYSLTHDQACARVITELQQAREAGWMNAAIAAADGGLLSTQQLANPALLANAIVHFGQSNQDFAGLDAARRLMEVMQEGRRWGKLVQDKERTLVLSEAYLTKLSKPSNDRFGASAMDDMDDDAFA